MKTKIFLSILFLVSIGIGVGFASSILNKDRVFRADPVQAVHEIASQSSEEISPYETSPTISAPILSSETITEENLSIAEASTIAQAKPGEVLQTLNTRAVKSLPIGWVHLREVKRFSNNPGDNGELPNQVAIPNNQIIDTWFNIGPNNVVLQSVSIMRTLDGQIVQIGVVGHGKAWNSATNEVQAVEPFKLESFDANFQRDFQRLQASGAEVQLSDLKTPDGQQGTQIILRDNFDTPIMDNVADRPIIAAETRALFSTETGYLLQKVVIFIFDDNSQRVFSQITQEIIFEQPTEEAAQYLAQHERR